jgi:hypothetical protein
MKTEVVASLWIGRRLVQTAPRADCPALELPGADAAYVPQLGSWRILHKTTAVSEAVWNEVNYLARSEKLQVMVAKIG